MTAPIDSPNPSPSTPSAAYSPEVYEQLFMARIRAWDSSRSRSQQKQQGVLGISDFFTCKERARRITIGDQGGDDFSMKAVLGTFLHAGLDEVTAETDPDILIKQRVTLTLPSGFQVPGTADEIDPREPSVTDWKSKDGLAVVMKGGSNDQQRSQRHGYAAAAVQEGIVRAEGLVVRNVYLDRSGRWERPFVEQEPYSPDVLLAMDDWYQDVLYAVEHDEPAQKNPDHCSYCPFALDNGGTCGADVSLAGRLLTTEEALAAQVLVESREAKKAAARAEEDAKRALAEVTDSAQGHGWQVVRTHVNAEPPYTTLKAREVA